MQAAQKKKILFTSKPMRCGGVEKALLSVLSVMDYDKYDVYYMPYTEDAGIWDFLVPKQVHRLKAPDYYRWHLMQRKDVRMFLRSNIMRPSFILAYLLSLFDGKRAGTMEVGRHRFWNRMKKRYPSYEEAFDIAVDFVGEIGCCMMIDKIHAGRKYAWYHGDVKNFTRDEAFELSYWRQLDRLVLVAETAKEHVRELYPVLDSTCMVIHNLVLRDKLYQMAALASISKTDFSYYVLSVGTLENRKGYENSIEACRILVKRGLDFRWHVLGEGPLKAKLSAMVKEYGLDDVFLFEGRQDNPYPYYKAADIFVLTSYSEGKPIVLDEAKQFNLPIVSTRFSTVEDQLIDGTNGTITDFEPEHIADAIEQLIVDKELRTRYSQWLEKHPLDMSVEIKKLNELWES